MDQRLALGHRDRSTWNHVRGLAAWCMFDWANSAFPTIVVTFVFANYFTRALASSPDQATAEWGAAISISGLAVAVLAPVFGAIADLGGRRKPWIGLFSMICIVVGLGLWTVEPHPSFALRALILVGIANAAYELGQVFYNAMLPDLAPRAMLGRVSGWAFAVGYAGGLACLATTLVVLIWPADPLFGLLSASDAEPARASAVLVSLWYFVFAIPMFLYTADRPGSGLSMRQAVGQGLANLVSTFRNLAHHRNIARFLLARMIYNDGLNTLFIFGGIYAAARFGMDTQEVLVFAILLNVASGIGAAAFGWVDDRIGAKRTILIAVAWLFVAGGAILLVETKLWFYVLGCAIGVFVGPAQSAARSLMARLAPEAMRTEMFGLYALSGKATAFMGPAAVTWVTLWSGSERLGMATILVFFMVGFVLMLWVRDADSGSVPKAG
jgi:UMF1 family MFS transporter